MPILVFSLNILAWLPTNSINTAHLVLLIEVL